MRRALLSITIIIVFLTLAISVWGILSYRSPQSLPSAEILNYQGQPLSNITDIRENAINGLQYINVSTYRLEIVGLVASPRNYTYDQVINDHQNYLKVVTINCVEGWNATILWQGVLVKDLIYESHPIPGATVVIFRASDGYTTSFPISYIVNNNIILAYKMNNVTIPPERGFPFQLVAESKWGYKWIKWVTTIELSNDTSFRGYWESNGYSNNGDINQSFLENP